MGGRLDGGMGGRPDNGMDGRMGLMIDGTVPDHGGNLRLASQRYAREDWIDYSANINPLGVPAVLAEALHAAISGGRLARYPDPDSVSLRAALALWAGVEPAGCLPANGASEALHLALSVLPRGEVALPVPCFGEYRMAATQQGHVVVPVAMDAFTVPVPTRRYAGVILGHPNNPTSRLLDRACLDAWLAACDWVVVDEAFVELTKEGAANSFVPLLASHPNLIVLRALTKLLAIPGLRLGYALGHPDWIARMKSRQIPWSVNALAQTVGAVMPKLEPYLAQTRDWLDTEPDWLHGALHGLSGALCGVPEGSCHDGAGKGHAILTVWRPDTNFLLCRAGVPAAPLVDRMAEHGFLLRNASNFHGLDASFFRVAVRLRGENEGLVEALRTILPDLSQGGP